MGIMSPDTPKLENEGMAEASKYFSARPWMKRNLVISIGEQRYAYLCASNKGSKAEGFRRMAYIVAQQRAA